MCALTFVWPITVSPDPSHAGFRFAAIAALIAFLASLVVLLACKARRIWAAAALVVIAVLAPLGFRLDG